MSVLTVIDRVQPLYVSSLSDIEANPSPQRVGIIPAENRVSYTSGGFAVRNLYIITSLGGGQ